MIASVANTAPTHEGRRFPIHRILRIRRVLVALTFLLSGGCSPHASDEVLLANFERNEAGFEQLLEMLRVDKELERVDATWTRPEDPSSIGISPQRIEEYRRLCSKLGIPRGFYASHAPEYFTFIASATGLSIAGSSKGYAYMEDRRPEHLVADLDEVEDQSVDAWAHRHIKGNWYLEYSNTRFD